MLQFQKWNKTHLAVLLGYKTIIWHHQSQNPGFSYDLMPVHCDTCVTHQVQVYTELRPLSTVHPQRTLPLAKGPSFITQKDFRLTGFDDGKIISVKKNQMLTEQTFCYIERLCEVLQIVQLPQYVGQLWKLIIY